MVKFINSAKVPAVKEGMNQSKVESFINLFNAAINKNKKNIAGDLTLNDGLDGIPTLNKSELLLAKMMAKQEGWTLTSFDDNYNTTSYKIVPIDK